MVAKRVFLGGSLGIVLFAAGFTAGHLWGHRLAALRYRSESDAIRAEQQRTKEQYRELGENLRRERELNNRLRAIVESAGELVQSNDLALSGLRVQLSRLREKIQELKAVFDVYTAGGVSGGAGNGAIDSPLN
jgi:hypothetical protein